MLRLLEICTENLYGVSVYPGQMSRGALYRHFLSPSPTRFSGIKGEGSDLNAIGVW